MHDVRYDHQCLVFQNGCSLCLRRGPNHRRRSFRTTHPRPLTAPIFRSVRVRVGRGLDRREGFTPGAMHGSVTRASVTAFYAIFRNDWSYAGSLCARGSLLRLGHATHAAGFFEGGPHKGARRGARYRPRAALLRAAARALRSCAHVALQFCAPSHHSHQIFRVDRRRLAGSVDLCFCRSVCSRQEWRRTR